MPRNAHDAIVVRGARQNNLRNLDLDLPLNELIVVTGVSGSGKSSLVFDTLYAEGQRRYVETFSPYARQFLDRMDKPQVDRIERIPPAIAIDQVNPVRTSRSTVGTMTEINDHLKLLYARLARLHCRGCGREVRRDDAQSICAALPGLLTDLAQPLLLVCFPVPVPANLTLAELKGELEKLGYVRIYREEPALLTMVQDRLRLPDAAEDRSRLVEALESALKSGHGRVSVHALDAEGRELRTLRFSSDLHCAECDLHYQDATQGLFSFNSPLGACDTCRGFGRVIGIDYGLVVPDDGKSLAQGAIRPWQTPSYKECQDDLLRFATRRGIPTDVPWRELGDEQRRWVIEGEGAWEKKVWYGARRFFSWLESRAYKMHIRVLLSKYRSYTVCESCGGARLKPDALLWRLGARAAAHSGAHGQRSLAIHEVMQLPIEECRRFFDTLQLGGALDEAVRLLLGELTTRLRYLCDVGLGYLTLDRQSRTLSGGEVQRINLTTALGTSLVNTLFVLDEPSIGLHPRDMQRVIGVMQRLRNAGNTLLVVEHDPQIMLEADRIIDLGPGAGEHGGRIVCNGSPREVMAHAQSATGAWLSGRRKLAGPARRAAPTVAMGRAAGGNALIRLRGAAEHNLRDLDVDIPLQRLVCLTGVSGSGKSTLVQDVLYPALLKAHGRPTESPGKYRALEGAELIESAVLIDQSPIGRTTRSNPASYVGAFDEIRARFAAEPESKLRRYTAGTFSFNSGKGRCPTCGGNGFEHIEMQFLSDVYLRCGDCQGRRYRPETLQIRLAGADGRRANIAEVLDLTVTEALAFFADVPAILQRLKPLADVGLDYVRLGQPVPTLSGGEAQRLKLAGHLAAIELPAGKRRGKASAAATGTGQTRLGKLLIFDEPTTGLHFEDIARLVHAFGLLLDAGHSLLVIEHNLDVIRAADWIIDLGPEGGVHGGQLIAAATPEALMQLSHSHTGRALRDYAAAAPLAGAAIADVSRVAEPPAPRAPEAIVVRGAREHNLKNVDVDIPRNRFSVITGVSGSGKSTLAFDILFNEGQRRYLESLNAYARQFVQPASRPDLDAIHGIPPTVAIEQRASRGGLKSTVATLTEIYHFLRLLYVRLGTQYCPDCELAIAPQSADSIVASLLRDYRGQRVQLLAPLITHRKGHYRELARWAAARGATQLRVDGRFVPCEPFPALKRFVEHNIELPVAQVDCTAREEQSLRQRVDEALELGKGVLHVLAADDAVAVFSSRRACPQCGRGFPEPDPRLLSFNSSQGWCEQCHGTGIKDLVGDGSEEHEHEHEAHSWENGDSAADGTDTAVALVCESCQGARLNPLALHLRFRDQSIGELTARSVDTLTDFFGSLRLGGREQAVARDALQEIRSRLAFLARVGLGYLALDRAAPSLSGGEAQRIRLAAQLGSNLQGVCYVLDEPTIGLHPRDNAVLLDALDQLSAAGNTLVVVEHDEDTIRRADHIIDLGPGAGVRGGQVVAAGTARALQANPASVTGRFLANPLRHPAAPRRATGPRTPALQIESAHLHNLRDLDVRVPLARLVVVTGVSGSGKSSLARDVLYANLRAMVGARAAVTPIGVRALHGVELVDRVLEVDQTPIGRTPRSCPATYVGFWDEIRRVFAGTHEARVRGYQASRFSFNTSGGRCSECEGAGIRTIEMSFLPDVKVLCERCGGRRFDRETLEIQWRGRSIGDVLAMNVEEAVAFFAAHPRIARPLQLLSDVGLGYLTLGQPSPTLSGGEAQRIKLVAELARLAQSTRGRPAHTLYVLDEPTVGLHMADVEKLVAVLHRLVDAGHSIVLIEHNLDVIAEADWIIDLGPEAGLAGGRVVAAGTPATIAARQSRSHTGAALARFLAERAA
ncbi:MAG TPA: excinuclease ABC subunit UvrA [Steroidobacteraceae bacterium]|jgi:excinuclease ABC subunit A|nr:excinuclease ABC subunit UvrA [Steroidobacteraceae bacterium]